MKTNSLDFDAQALREKILDLAMRGKLVPQDPNDEPASVLLEKIKAEKAELIKEKKIKKTKPLPPITDDEKPFDIPDSWEWVRLGDVAEIIMGQAPKGNTVNSECDGIEFHQGKTEFTEDIIGKSDKFTTSLNKVIDSDYIVMAVRAPVGDVNLVNRKIAIGRGLSGIKGYVSDKNYIFYYLGSMKEYYNQRSTGSTFKAINGNVIKNTPIALPPLSEQSRIAAKIVQLFALLRKVETSTQQYVKLQTLLKSKVLDLAMRGKLVKQDPNDEPASVLLEKIKAEKQELIKEKKIKKTKPLPPITDDEKPFDIPDSWEWVRLGDIVFNYDGKRVPVSIADRKKRAKIYDYYGASGVIDKIDDYLFSQPRLLISEDGANLLARNKPIAFIARGKYWVNNHAHIMDSIDINILKFIANYINNTKLNSFISGSAQPKLNQQNLNKIPVPFSPLSEQKKINVKLKNIFLELKTQ